jgi:CheY-like chemotaxis protein
MRRMLAVLGFEATIVSDGLEAVTAACRSIAAAVTSGAQPEFAAILMDIQVHVFHIQKGEYVVYTPSSW